MMAICCTKFLTLTLTCQYIFFLMTAFSPLRTSVWFFDWLLGFCNCFVFFPPHRVLDSKEAKLCIENKPH